VAKKATKKAATKQEKRVYNVAPDLEPLLLAVALIEEDPENENEHPLSQVKLMSERFADIGMQKPINVWELDNGARFMIKAGHAQLRAAKLLGWTHVPAVRFMGNELEAAAFRISDNTISGMSKMNEVKLATSAVKLEANIKGFEPGKIGLEEGEFKRITADLKASAGESPEIKPPGEDTGKRGGGLGKPVIQYNIIFDTEDQQKKWYAFMRTLKELFPSEETAAARLDKFLDDYSTGETVAGEPKYEEGPVGKDHFVVSFSSASEYKEWLEMQAWIGSRYGGDLRVAQGILKLFSEATGE
jgi:hypothetical protein